MATQNRVVGRGKLYFDKFVTDTQQKTGERYLGNTPSLSMTSAYQNLDHYDSDEGLSNKDDSVTLRVDRNGTFTCDNIIMDNVALVFGTEATIESLIGNAGLSETFTATLGRYYQLGSDVNFPDGIPNIDTVVVTDNTGLHAFGLVTFAANPANLDTVTINGQTITFVTGSPLPHQVQIGANTVITAQRFLVEINGYPGLFAVTASGIENAITLRAIMSGTGGNARTMAKSGTNPTLSGATLSGGAASGVIGITGNYEVDAARGRIHILENAADIATGDVIEIQYNHGLFSRHTVIDGETQVEGALRFLADNPKGTDKDYYWPRVKLSPSGEYALKGDTWQTMTFNFEVLTPAIGKRVYVREAVAA